MFLWLSKQVPVPKPDVRKARPTGCEETDYI
jgi:hypothetical protein